tara:strand:- start:2811 stop:5024 length:2214 start_codon:yes stop_codon:yes gene_type:complete
MAIKIYQSDIRPTTEITQKTSTPGMRVDERTMTAIPRAFKGMMTAGEDFYIKYEKQKAENQIIEASKNIDRDDVSENIHGAKVVNKEGLATRVNKYKSSTRPDEAMSAYKADWQKTLDLTLPKLSGPFAKKMFKNYMNKRFISESGTIRDSTFVNFRNESRSLKLKQLDDISYRVANSQVGSKSHEMAIADKNAFFANSSNSDLFGDKFQKLKFDTDNNIDVLTITKHLSLDALQTKINFDNGVYKGLDAETRIKIGNKITLAAQQKVLKNIESDNTRVENGLPPEHDNSQYLKMFEGYENYDEVKTQIEVQKFVYERMDQIHNGKQKDLSTVKFYDLVGTGDEIKAKKAANTILAKAITDRQNSIKNNDVAGYLIKTVPEIKTLDEKIQNTTDLEQKKILIEEKKLLIEQKFIDLGISKSKQFYISQNEIKSTVAAITSPDKTWQEKKAIMLSLGELYGNENMPGILKQLAGEKLPEAYVIAMSTNSAKLNEDILQGYNMKDLEKVALAELPKNISKKDINRKISEKINDFETVIESQNSGSFDDIQYKAKLQDTLYRAVLVRVDRGDNYNEAIQSVTREFLSDYTISPEKTFFVPKDVNGKSVSQIQVFTKAEAIKLEIENGDYYLDTLMGEKGYKHYASNSEIKNLSDEDIKTRIKSAIQKDSKFLLNDTSTGVVLHFTWYDGTMVPVVNADGQKVEFLFTDTSYVYPHTDQDLTVIEEYDIFSTDEDGAGVAG